MIRVRPITGARTTRASTTSSAVQPGIEGAGDRLLPGEVRAVGRGQRTELHQGLTRPVERRVIRVGLALVQEGVEVRVVTEGQAPQGLLPVSHRAPIRV